MAFSSEHAWVLVVDRVLGSGVGTVFKISLGLFFSCTGGGVLATRMQLNAKPELCTVPVPNFVGVWSCTVRGVVVSPGGAHDDVGCGGGTDLDVPGQGGGEVVVWHGLWDGEVVAFGGSCGGKVDSPCCRLLFSKVGGWFWGSEYRRFSAFSPRGDVRGVGDISGGDNNRFSCLLPRGGGGVVICRF